jgi:hypothetical protein
MKQFCETVLPYTTPAKLERSLVVSPPFEVKGPSPTKKQLANWKFYEETKGMPTSTIVSIVLKFQVMH